MVWIYLRTIMISMRVCRELPMRGILVNLSIFWIVVTRTRILIQRTLIQLLTDCVLRSLSQICWKLVLPGSCRVGIGNGSNMSTIGKRPPRRSLMCHGIIGIVFGWARVIIVRPHFSLLSHGVLGSFTNKCSIIVLSRSKLI